MCLSELLACAVFFLFLMCCLCLTRNCQCKWRICFHIPANTIRDMFLHVVMLSAVLTDCLCDVDAELSSWTVWLACRVCCSFSQSETRHDMSGFVFSVRNQHANCNVDTFVVFDLDRRDAWTQIDIRVFVWMHTCLHVRLRLPYAYSYGCMHIPTCVCMCGCLLWSCSFVW